MPNPSLDGSGPKPVIRDGDEGPPHSEKRRHRRVELGVRCWLTDERHTVYLRLHDLSLGGLSVRAPVPFTPAGQIDVGLELPSGRTVRARGEIVWVRAPAPPEASAAGPGMGVRFVAITDGEGEAELSSLLDA